MIESGSYLTTEEVSEIHNVSRGTVIQWIKKGWIKAQRVNQIFLVRKEDADNFIRRKKTGRPRKVV